MVRTFDVSPYGRGESRTMRNLRFAPVGAALALLTVAVTACGTTVSGTAASTTAGSDSTLGASAAQAATGPSAAPGAAGLSLGGSSPAAGGPAGSLPNASGVSAGGTSTGAAAGGSAPLAQQQGAEGPGLTATTMNVGVAYSNDAGAADSALGAAGASPGDTRADETALFKYINDHGGIAGRKINPVWYQQSVSKSAATTYEEMCQTWTKDHKTFVIETVAPDSDQCIADAGGIGIGAGAIAVGTTPKLQHFPMAINLTGFTIDRSMGVTIRGLARQGYFSSGAKVGIATWDDPQYHYGISASAVPNLAALGIHNVPVEYITVPQSYGDVGATSASVSNAVLQFASRGIDHVILFDGGAGINNSGILVLEWMQQANSQRYYPRYGLNTTSGFNSLASDYPQRELVNSIGVDWYPSLSMTSAQYTKYPLAPNGKLCLKIMAAAGQKQSSGNAQALQLGFCETYFFLKQALASVKGPLNQQTALAAINAMGSTYKSSVTFGIDINAGRHDGGTLVRNMAFNTSCSCYEYTSGSYNTGG